MLPRVMKVLFPIVCYETIWYIVTCHRFIVVYNGWCVCVSKVLIYLWVPKCYGDLSFVFVLLKSYIIMLLIQMIFLVFSIWNLFVFFPLIFHCFIYWNCFYWFRRFICLFVLINNAYLLILFVCIYFFI